MPQAPTTADIVIAGGGVAGLMLALELRARGRDVLLLERTTPGAGASRAAAGMLATHDPAHPAALQPLANLAHDLYPALYDRIRALSGHPLPYQTQSVLEADAQGAPALHLLPNLAPKAGIFTLRPEHSINPRDLVAALAAAAANTGVLIRTKTELTSATPAPNGICLQTNSGDSIHAQQFIDCTGAWSAHFSRPAKGQMLRVQLPPDALRLPEGGNAVVRTPDIYIVPRLDGTALIGATVEDAGFDTTTSTKDLNNLRAKAAQLLPAAATAPEVETWAGLRPRTADDLPILGELRRNHLLLTGLFRNGILLAPAAAHLVAQLLSGEPTAIPLAPFSPHRASLHGTAEPHLTVIARP